MPVDMSFPMMSYITKGLQDYVVSNPEATIPECIGVVMGFGVSQEIAQEVIGFVAQQFEDLTGNTMTFDEIKEQSIAAASIPDVPTESNS